MPSVYSGIGNRISVDSQGNNPSKNLTLVCKLTKSLYGLKQAPRQWFKKLSTSLVSFGYTQSKADYSLFTRMQGNSVTIVLVYVDDLLITGNNKEEIARIKKMLASHFHMKDQGSLRYFLGLEIDHTDQGIFISQKKYTTDLLREEGLLNVKPLKLPVDSHLKLSADKRDTSPRSC
uniref:Reverse transcriptase Ty1/copia-type domain-containing protein n=1 Tax=Chenopodium quinoa TaxID=63459 RepID=A0A803LDK6_CHEQI